MMGSKKQKRCNWMKASRALLYLKEGIEEELDDKANVFHEHIKQLVAAKCKTAVAAPRCTYCTYKSIKRSKRQTNSGTIWYVNCRSNVCNHWLDALIQFHSNLPSPNVEWANCDLTLWPSQPWEIAKAFQPYGCGNTRNAVESDVAALLTLMQDCKFFGNLLYNKQRLGEVEDEGGGGNVLLQRKKKSLLVKTEISMAEEAAD